MSEFPQMFLAAFGSSSVLEGDSPYILQSVLVNLFYDLTATISGRYDVPNFQGAHINKTFRSANFGIVRLHLSRCTGATEEYKITFRCAQILLHPSLWHQVKIGTEPIAINFYESWIVNRWVFAHHFRVSLRLFLYVAEP